MKSGNLNFLEPSGPLQTCNWSDLPFIYCCISLALINIHISVTSWPDNSEQQRLKHANCVSITVLLEYIVSMVWSYSTFELSSRSQTSKCYTFCYFATYRSDMYLIGATCTSKTKRLSIYVVLHLRFTYVNKLSHYGEPVREFLFILYESSVRTTQRTLCVPIRRSAVYSCRET